MVQSLCLLSITTRYTQSLYFRPPFSYLRSTARKYFGSSIVLNIRQRYSILYRLLSNISIRWWCQVSKESFHSIWLSFTPKWPPSPAYGAKSGISSSMQRNVFWDLVSNFIMSSLTTLSITLKSKFLTVIVTLGFYCLVTLNGITISSALHLEHTKC